MVALLGVGLLAAACGGGGPASLGVASLGKTPTTTVPAASSDGTGTSDYTQGVAYAKCMRSHGVENFPDPTSTGDFITDKGELNGQRVNTGSAQFASADKACTHLLPNGGTMTPAEQQQALAQALKLVQCLRTHGIPDMPDPSTSGGGVNLRPPAGVNLNSPQFQSAQQACRSLQPFAGS